jgi:hypothetical protein
MLLIGKYKNLLIFNVCGSSWVPYEEEYSSVSGIWDEDMEKIGELGSILYTFPALLTSLMIID